MLKFFRKIRHQLLTEKKFSAYLPYAIGEVVLVVIGILIALQINNWNESRKTNIEEQKYLHSLKEEFQFNLEGLEKTMQINEQNLNAAVEILKYTGPDPKTVTIEKEELAKLLFGVVNKEIKYRPRFSVLDEIISSGKLGIFDNEKLRSSLSSWRGVLNKVEYQEDELAKWRFGLLDFAKIHGNARKGFFDSGRQAILDVPPSRFEEKNSNLLQYVEFENLLFYFASASKFTNINYYSGLKKEILEILESIDQEIN